MTPQQPKTILLVEDDALIAMTGARTLKKFGYDVITANTGEKGVQIATGEKTIDLILMDIDLGKGIDGPQAAQQILEKRSIPIVFLTSHSEKEYVDRVKQITRYGYVIKNSGDFVLQSSIEMAFELFDAHRDADSKMDALQESEARFRLLFNSGRDAIAVHLMGDDGRPTHFTQVNDVACERLGYTREEMLNLSPQDIDAPDCSAQMPAVIEELMKNKYVLFETVHISKDGRRIPVEVSTVLFQLNDRKATLSAARDMTQRKQAEKELQKIENNYRRIVETANEGILVLDCDARLTYANQRMASMLGYAIEEMIGRKLESFLPEDQLSDHIVQMTNRAQGKDTDYERCFRSKEGGKIWTYVSVKIIYDAEGRREGSFGMLTDISERKKAEGALRAKTEELDQYFTSSLDLLCIANTEGYFLRLNPEWEKVLGYPIAELVGKRFLDFVHPQDLESTLASVSALSGQEDVLNFVNRYRCQDGSYKWIEWRSKPLGNMIYAIARDITDRKQAELALQEKNEEYESLNEELRSSVGDLQATEEELRVQNDELQRAEEVLRESEEKYRMLFHANKDSISIFGIGADGNPTNFLEVNDATTEIFGHTKEELSSMSIALFEAGVTEEVRKRKIEDLQSKGSVDFETIVRDKAGREKTLEVKAIRIDYQNKPAIMNISRDITERRRAEDALQTKNQEYEVLNEELRSSVEELQATEEELRTQNEELQKSEEALTLTRMSLESASDSLFWMKPNGRIVDANAAACRTLGYSRDELLKLSVPDVDAQYNAEIWAQHFPDLRKHGTLKFESEQRAKNGRLIPVEIVANYVQRGKEEYYCAFVRDITERKLSESYLQQSKSRLDLAQTASNAGIWDWNVATGEIEWTDQMFRLLGLDSAKDPASFDSWRRALHPEDVQTAERRISDALEYHTRLNSDYRIITPDGDMRWINAVGEGQYDEKGKAYRMLGICIDISQRKQAEELITKSQERFVAYFNMPMHGITITSPEKGWLEVNDKICSMLGYSREELMQLNWADLTHPEDLAADEKYFQEVVAGTINHYSLDKRFIRKDKNIVWTNISVGCVRSHEGCVEYFICLMDDISGRKEAEYALRESEKRLHNAQSVAHAGSWIWNIEKAEVEWSEEMYRIFGINKETVSGRLGDAISKVIHPDDLGIFQASNVQAFGERKPIEYRVIWPDQSVHYIVAETGDVIRDLNGVPVFLTGTSQDITERKRLENQLRENEDRLRDIIFSVGDWVWEVNEKGVYTHSSQKGLDILGRSCEDIIGKTPFDFMPPEEAKRVATIFSKIGEEKASIKDIENWNLTKNGERICLLTNGVPILDPDGNLKGYRGVDRDITERKRMEESLRETKTILETALDQSSAGIAIADAPSGNLRYVNDAGLLIRGGNLQAIVDGVGINQYVSSWQLLDLDGRPLRTEEVPLARAVMFGETNSREFIVRRENNDDRIILGNAAPIRNDKDEVVAGIVVFTDITERKQAEEVLRKSEEKYRLLFDGASDAIFIHAQDGNVLEVNLKACEQLGYTHAELISATNAHLDSPVESLHQPDRISRLKDHGQLSYETVHTRKDGSRVPSEVNVRMITWDGQPAMMSICRDITERKQSEEEIKNLLKGKELLMKEVHHRIKNNMNAMMSLLSLQAESTTNAEATAALNDASNRLRSMMLLYDRLYRSENIDEVSVKKYLSQLVKDIFHAFPSRIKIKTKTKLDEFHLTTKTISPLGIIINELLTNIMKYAFVGRDKGMITVSASLKDKYATVVVQDDGVGIPESVDIGNSTGFGLQLVDMLTKQIDGTIRIERGNGTKFILEFQV